MYRRIVEAVPEGIWIVDPQGQTIFSNRRMAEILRLSPEEMQGHSCFSSVYPDDLAAAQGHFARTMAGDRRPFEFRMRRGDGSPVWVSITCMQLWDASSQVGLFGLFSDVTDRRQAEAALKESEERFRSLADTAPVMMWTAGTDKLVNFYNKTWLDYTGRTLEQELGNGWVTGVHPEDIQHVWDDFSSAFEARRPFQNESRVRRADGEYRRMLCSGVPRFDQDGNFTGYIGTDTDITDLQSEERFRQLAENSDQVFWMLDLDERGALFVSSAFEKVWGSSSAEIYNDPNWLLSTIHPEDRERVRAFFQRSRSEATEESYRIVRPDGSVRWIQDRAFLVRNAEGKPYRVAGIVEDITAQKDLEEQLRNAQKMEAVGRLAGGVAHDFNNLLTVIVGYSQMLLDEARRGDATRLKLEQILSAANRASTLTTQLLAFSRRQVLQPKLVNVNHLLTSMQSLLRRIIGEHIAVEATLHPDVGCIWADPQQLEQVILNLAANARDSMPNGGQFRIETKIEDGFGAQGDGGTRVRLRISDTGCGMDSRTRERAFEPFFTTKEVGKGTGLGLSTVYGIVRQNQGTIRVSSEPGQGTVFELHFPAAAGVELEIEAPAKLLAKAEVTQTVLLAEDEPAVRNLVRETLVQLGYTVLEAGDGYEALRVMEQCNSTVHLLLTDVIMPLMNGPELASRLEAIRPGIQVLYMSGYTDDMLAFHGIAPEIHFIQKPFTAAALAEKLQTVLSANKGKAVAS
jgi:hypothetical protein